MSGSDPFVWRDKWVRRCITALVVFTFAAIFCGFVWLPAKSQGFSGQGLWATICRAAGVPSTWSEASRAPPGSQRATTFVLERSMTADSAKDAVGRGATLALNCTMCHGAEGLSSSEAPNLAGQYPEVVIKQLHDYRSGIRSSAIMHALTQKLSEQDIVDLAAYYGYLPKARNAPTTYRDALPVLVRVGAPLRNIAPCISCHGNVDQKLGTPWLEGMPKGYLVTQLTNFRSNVRYNDSHAQMRNMARAMTTEEIEEVAEFYARRTENN